MNMLLLEDRAQLDPGWIVSDLAAVVEDFLRAQLDPGYKAEAQLDPGTKTPA